MKSWLLRIQSNLIDPYHFLEISPRNLTSFTRLFLTGRDTWAGHKTNVGLVRQAWTLVDDVALLAKYINVTYIIVMCLASGCPPYKSIGTLALFPFFKRAWE